MKPLSLNAMQVLLPLGQLRGFCSAPNLCGLDWLVTRRVEQYHNFLFRNLWVFHDFSGSHWFGIFHTNDGLPNCSTTESDVRQSASSRQTFQACSREWCSKSIPRHGNPPVTSKNSRLPLIRLFLGFVLTRVKTNLVPWGSHQNS